jgi:predicted Zn-dependent peptidase
MRRNYWMLAAWLTLAGLTDSPAGAVVDDPGTRTRITELPNGLTVLTLEDSTTPVVSLQLWVRVGSRDETRYTGLAHLFEHMMFRGTGRLAPERHARLIESRGGKANAYTTRDLTVYFEDMTADTLPLALELEAERFAHLRIVDETLAREREVVLQERRLRTEEHAGGRAYEALFGLAFQAHAYRRPVLGWRSDLERVTVEACREFFRTYYAPNNVVMVIVGDFDAESTLTHVERTFGSLPPVEIPRSPTEEPEQLGERRGTVRFNVHGPILAVAWHAPPAGNADAEALDVTGEILSAGRSSRLYQRLVYREAQALFASGSYWEMLDAGLFYAFAEVRPDASIERVEELLFEEIARVREESVPEDEVAKAKRQIEVALIRAFTTAHSLASRIASDYVVLGRIRPLDARVKAIRAVSSADVQRVARTYLVDDQRTVVHVVPPPASSDAAAVAGP